MKPVDVKSSTYIDSSKEINEKDPKFKQNKKILLEYQNIKTFLQIGMFKIGLKKFVLVILQAKKLLERFTKKNCKKQFKKCC